MGGDDRRTDSRQSARHAWQDAAFCFAPAWKDSGL